MNLSSLTTDEILRMHSPETALEVQLFQRLEEALDCVSIAEQELREIEDQSCDSCDEKSHEISDLEDDKLELEDKIKALRSLCDENEIDHSDI